MSLGDAIFTGRMVPCGKSKTVVNFGMFFCGRKKAWGSVSALLPLNLMWLALWIGRLSAAPRGFYGSTPGVAMAFAQIGSLLCAHVTTGVNLFTINTFRTFLWSKKGWGKRAREVHQCEKTTVNYGFGLYYGTLHPVKNGRKSSPPLWRMPLLVGLGRKS